jgi:hypothetical protein
MEDELLFLQQGGILDDFDENLIDPRALDLSDPPAPPRFHQLSPTYEQLYGRKTDYYNRPYNLRGSPTPYYAPRRSGTRRLVSSVPSLLGTEYVPPSDPIYNIGKSSKFNETFAPSQLKMGVHYPTPGYDLEMKEYWSDIARRDKAAEAAARGIKARFYEPEGDTKKSTTLSETQKKNIKQKWLSEVGTPAGLTSDDMPLIANTKNLDYDAMKNDYFEVRKRLGDGIRKALKNTKDVDKHAFAKMFERQIIKEYIEQKKLYGKIPTLRELSGTSKVDTVEDLAMKGDVPEDVKVRSTVSRSKLPGKLGAAAALTTIPGLVKAGNWADVGGILAESMIGADPRDFVVIPEGSVDRSKDWWKKAFGLLTSPFFG